MPDHAGFPFVRIEDEGRVRTLVLDRPEALNALNSVLTRSLAEALAEAAVAPDVAVVIMTGTGRAFSAGADVVEWAGRSESSEPDRDRSDSPSLVLELSRFPKPLIFAVNGLALGLAVTILGYADLVIMSRVARVRCPFTDLAVAPEAGSSYLFPLLLGRQKATWLLMSSEWFTAEECLAMGLAWRVCDPDDLQQEARAVASLLAAKPIASLVESKRTLVAGYREGIAAASAREQQAFQRLVGQPANVEAFAALAARRTPDFLSVDAEHPVDVARHAADGP